jgi:ABC-type oligopeptide transport system substrate-binding subunit
VKWRARAAALAAFALGAASVSGCSLLRAGEAEPGVLRLGLVRVASVDPARAGTLDEQLLADQLFDGLTRWDPATGEAVPALAASWRVSDDGKRWTFELRPGGRFSNGEPVTVTDVLTSIGRITQEGSSSPVRDLLAGASFSGDTQNSRALQFDLPAPWADLPSALANPAFGIMPADQGSQRSFPSRPVGSGPFRLAGRSADGGLTLRPVRGRGAKLERVDVRFFADRTAAYAAFVDGDVDWSEVPVTKVEEAAARFGRRHFRPYAAELFYAFNMRSAKWADRRLREAVVRAVDRSAIAEDVYRGAVRPLAGLVPAGVTGHAADACGDACTVDVERAKALVSEVTAANGAAPQVAIDFERDAAQESVAAALERDLEAVGFEVTLRPLALDDYQRFAVSGEADLFRFGWVPAYPAADAYLSPLFASASADNVPGFALSTVDDLLAAARATPDPPARTALYQQAERAVLAELPVLPLAQYELHGVASRRVRGLEVGVMGTFDVAAISLADS